MQGKLAQLLRETSARLRVPAGVAAAGGIVALIAAMTSAAVADVTGVLAASAAVVGTILVFSQRRKILRAYEQQMEAKRVELIQAIEQQGDLGFQRDAVGDHLLLGGDNMDLALAKFVETRLPGAGRLDAAQYGMLTQACRNAKEVLLGPHPAASHTVTVMGRGRQVVGGAQHASITPQDVQKIIFEGFLPLVPIEAEPARGARTGLHEMGLPYVGDPAITRGKARCDPNRLSSNKKGITRVPLPACGLSLAITGLR